MKTIYHAANALEAHMLQDLLQQERISAFVRGEHLQGALGELPAAGLIQLMVNDDDYVRARAVVERWDAAQPRDSRPAPVSASGPAWWAFALGIVVGLILCRWLFTG